MFDGSDTICKQKLKVCMHAFKQNQESMMLAHIKGLPEGPLKKSLLETYIRTIQKGSTPEERKPPLFLDTSFDKNVKTYMKFNREPKPQDLSIIDLHKQVQVLRQEVLELKEQNSKTSWRRT
jgi:hypothetical protein